MSAIVTIFDRQCDMKIVFFYNIAFIFILFYNVKMFIQCDNTIDLNMNYIFQRYGLNIGNNLFLTVNSTKPQWFVRNKFTQICVWLVHYISQLKYENSSGGNYFFISGFSLKLLCREDLFYYFLVFKIPPTCFYSLGIGFDSDRSAG